MRSRRTRAVPAGSPASSWMGDADARTSTGAPPHSVTMANSRVRVVTRQQVFDTCARGIPAGLADEVRGLAPEQPARRWIDEPQDALRIHHDHGVADPLQDGVGERAGAGVLAAESGGAAPRGHDSRDRHGECERDDGGRQGSPPARACGRVQGIGGKTYPQPLGPTAPDLDGALQLEGSRPRRARARPRAGDAAALGILEFRVEDASGLGDGVHDVGRPHLFLKGEHLPRVHDDEHGTPSSTSNRGGIPHPLAER